ncbi:MAG: hypothetical protein WD751_05900 [Anaerolineales bacterium]
MQFLKDLLYNLGLVALAALILYILFPEQAGAMYQMYWMIYGPIILLVLLIYALPGRRRRR